MAETPAGAAGRRTALTWTVVFGLAFGWVEAMIVVYLRELYHPEGFDFPIVLMEMRLALLELLREAATLVMLLAVARLRLR